MSRILTLIALALAAAAVAVSVAEAATGAQSGTTVDPLAVSYLNGKGLSTGEVESWTTGACSHDVKDASCYAMLDPTFKTVDPVAVSYLTGLGLSQGEVRAWTVGACSHEIKDASCYAMLEPTRTISTPSIGFRWADAGIGAAATLGIVFLLGALGAAFVSRHNRSDRTAHA